MPTRIQDLLTYAPLIGVLILALLGIHGCAAAPPPRPPEWHERVDVNAAVLLDGDGYRCSGVAVGDDLVLTARHCVVDPSGAPRGPFTIVAFPGVRYQAETYELDPVLDLAMVRVGATKPLPVQAPFAREMPKEGDVVFQAGFGCYEALAVAPGLFLGTAPDGDLAFAMGVCPGDSGGPVFDGDGNLLAIISARSVDKPIAFAVSVVGM